MHLFNSIVFLNESDKNSPWYFDLIPFVYISWISSTSSDHIKLILWLKKLGIYTKITIISWIWTLSYLFSCKYTFNLLFKKKNQKMSLHCWHEFYLYKIPFQCWELKYYTHKHLTIFSLNFNYKKPSFPITPIHIIINNIQTQTFFINK